MLKFISALKLARPISSNDQRLRSVSDSAKACAGIHRKRNSPREPYTLYLNAIIRPSQYREAGRPDRCHQRVMSPHQNSADS